MGVVLRIGLALVRVLIVGSYKGNAEGDGTVVPEPHAQATCQLETGVPHIGGTGLVQLVGAGSVDGAGFDIGKTAIQAGLTEDRATILGLII